MALPPTIGVAVGVSEGVAESRGLAEGIGEGAGEAEARGLVEGVGVEIEPDEVSGVTVPDVELRLASKPCVQAKNKNKDEKARNFLMFTAHLVLVCWTVSPSDFERECLVLLPCLASRSSYCPP